MEVYDNCHLILTGESICHVALNADRKVREKSLACPVHANTCGESLKEVRQLDS